MKIDEFDKLRWSSDWNGYEVGFPEVDVVGLYGLELPSGQDIELYIDVDSGKVLEVFFNEQDI